eukprot:3657360-Prymnesium_polylepis.2
MVQPAQNGAHIAIHAPHVELGSHECVQAAGGVLRSVIRHGGDVDQALAQSVAPVVAQCAVHTPRVDHRRPQCGDLQVSGHDQRRAERHEQLIRGRPIAAEMMHPRRSQIWFRSR